MSKFSAQLASLYFLLPIKQGYKVRLKFFIFKYLGYFCRSLPAYQNWVIKQTYVGEVFPNKAEPTIFTPQFDFDTHLIPRNSSHNIQFTIIIPVYLGYDETLNAIYSCLSSKTNLHFHLIVINDASPDQRLVEKLNKLAVRGLFTIIHNSENLGFVKTVNIGMNNALGDVLLFNSDAELYDYAFDRIYKASNSSENVATVTPFSNNADLSSYPFTLFDNYQKLEISYPELDALFAEYNSGKISYLPTGHGFCLYIKRNIIEKIGVFDEQRFGRGYGEENDFCLKSAQAGYENIIALDVFVRHLGGVSFGEEKKQRIENGIKLINSLHPGYSNLISHFVNSDLLSKYRRNIDIARVRKFFGPKECILFITHNLGGGVEKKIQEEIQEAANQNIGVIIIRAASNKLLFEVVGLVNIPNLIGNFAYLQELAEIINALNVKMVKIYHLINFPNDFPAKISELLHDHKVPYEFMIHDFFAICPRAHLVNERGVYCGEPSTKSCNNCLKNNSSYALGATNIEDWRGGYDVLLSNASKIIAPSIDSQERINKYFEYDVEVRPHENLNILPPKQKKGKKIAIIGFLAKHKGFDVLVKIAKYAKINKLPLEFLIVGSTINDKAFTSLDNVKITGSYNDQDIGGILSDSRIALFLSTCPETYSYTLSHAFTNSLYPVAFDVGAIAERIKTANFGKLIPLDYLNNPKEICDILIDL